MLTHSAKIVQTSEIDEVCFNDYYTKKENKTLESKALRSSIF